MRTKTTCRLLEEKCIVDKMKSIWGTKTRKKELDEKHLMAKRKKHRNTSCFITVNYRVPYESKNLYIN